jgi:hypothetical protein
MGYWTKSRLIFNSIREHAQASIRQMARQTGRTHRSLAIGAVYTDVSKRSG